MNKNLQKTTSNRNIGLIAVVTENKMTVFTLSGSLKNNFDAAKASEDGQLAALAHLIKNSCSLQIIC